MFIFLPFFSVYLYAEKNATILPEHINVFSDGKLLSDVNNVYKISSQQINYFSAKEVGKLYNLTLKRNQSKQVLEMFMKNNKINIFANSIKTIFEKKEKEILISSIFTNEDVYISSEFLCSKEFAEITMADTVWDYTSRTLKITHSPNISLIKYFSEQYGTKIVIQLDRPLLYNVFRSSDFITIKILRGVIDYGLIHVNNDTVSDILCSNDEGYAIIKIGLKKSPKFVKELLSCKNDVTFISIDIINSENTNLNDDSKEFIKKQILNKKITDVNLDESNKFSTQQQTDSEITKKDNSINNDFLIKDNDDAIKYNDDYVFKQKKKTNNIFSKKRIIVIDAGHGGQDPGAIGPNGTKEKDINLAIVHELKALFDNNKNYEIILTRNDDTFISLFGRADIANKIKADLFLSIHCNSTLNRNINNFEAYVFSNEKVPKKKAPSAVEILENSVLEIEKKVYGNSYDIIKNVFWSLNFNEYINDSLELCGFIVQEAKKKLEIPVSDPRDGDFYVLRAVRDMPGVLVETAYISNYSQEKVFTSKNRKFIVDVANVVYEGVIKYYENEDKKLSNDKQ
ncbi:MAG: N-acetylmuramoyl-L-alanine amidase [Endomicrobium sp.]|nr:N-acetylmuramoyl-L-alanine amidase [Endomicrobium sp.]